MHPLSPLALRRQDRSCFDRHLSKDMILQLSYNLLDAQLATPCCACCCGAACSATWQQRRALLWPHTKATRQCISHNDLCEAHESNLPHWRTQLYQTIAVLLPCFMCLHTYLLLYCWVLCLVSADQHTASGMTEDVSVYDVGSGIWSTYDPHCAFGAR